MWLINNRNLFFTITEVRKSMIKVTVDSVWWGPTSWSIDCCLLAAPYKGTGALWDLFYKGTNTLWGLCPHNLITSQRVHLQIRFQHGRWIWRRDTVYSSTYPFFSPWIISPFLSFTLLWSFILLLPFCNNKDIFCLYFKQNSLAFFSEAFEGLCPSWI